MGFGFNEDEQAFEWEGRRQALAQLLKARRHPEAAAVVAVSQYRTDWSGDGTTVTLAVPAELYDAARSEFSDEIRNACIEIVGSDEFGDVIYRVLTPPYDTNWIEAIVSSLNGVNGRRWVRSERVDTVEIDSAAS